MDPDGRPMPAQDVSPTPNTADADVPASRRAAGRATEGSGDNNRRNARYVPYDSPAQMARARTMPTPPRPLLDWRKATTPTDPRPPPRPPSDDYDALPLLLPLFASRLAIPLPMSPPLLAENAAQGQSRA